MDQVIRTWEDGHRLLRDSRQWIVQHPRACQNAQRGGGSYTRETYFTQETNMERELRDCAMAKASGATVAAS